MKENGGGVYQKEAELRSQTYKVFLSPCHHL